MRLPQETSTRLVLESGKMIPHQLRSHRHKEFLWDNRYLILHESANVMLGHMRGIKGERKGAIKLIVNETISPPPR